ncbi:hypothetical protein [Streptomyces sp. NPDC002156]
MLLLAPLLGRHTGGWAGLGWGMTSVVFTAVLPTLILGLLYGFDAPRAVTALVTAMLAVLLALLAITFFWKVSVHSAVASAAVAVLTSVFGPGTLVLVPLVALIAWSRVRLRCHTVGQVTVGALVGAAVGASVFDLLR